MKNALAKNVAILVTTIAMISLASGPASAIEKPTDSNGIYIEADVNAKDPRVSSDESGKDKFFTPCNNLMVAVAPPGFFWSGEFRWLACSFWGEVVAYPKMKFKSLSGLAVPIYWN